MANNLEIFDSATKSPEPFSQLAQECWSFDRGTTMLPKGHDVDPKFVPLSGDKHINIGGEDFVIVGDHDSDPRYNPSDKGGLTGGGSIADLLPKIADGKIPDRLEPDAISGGSLDAFVFSADAGPKKPSEEQLKGAEKAVDAKVDTNAEKLSPEQQEVRKRLDHAILEGNQQEVEAIMRGYEKNPQELRSVMAAVSSDLGPAGVHVGFDVASSMIGADEDFHPVGILNISRDGASGDVEFSTDKRLQTSVGNCGVAMIADPGRAMQDIGNYGVEHLSK